MIDVNENLIIIKDKIVTQSINSCVINKKGLYEVVYKSSDKKYLYRQTSLIWLKSPQKIDSEKYKIYHNNNRLTHVKSIAVFTHFTQLYWHVTYTDGYFQDYNDKEINIVSSCLSEKKSNNVFKYLCEVADNNNLISDDGCKLLKKQYEKVDFISEDSALSCYLNPKKYKIKERNVGTLIFPFGSNSSQKQAVKSAFENQISIIQGPPGTGKTQTILNIVANLLLQNKTVQIVSSNNSAIENIIEKLSKYDLDFFTALLGNSSNKSSFIENQKKYCSYPKDIKSWKNYSANLNLQLQKIEKGSEILLNIFSKQEELAVIKKERMSLTIEYEHFKKEFPENIIEVERKKMLNSSIALRLWSLAKGIINREKGVRLKDLFYGFSWGIFSVIFTMIFPRSLKESFKLDGKSIIISLQNLFYQLRLSELESKIVKIELWLKQNDAKNLNKRLSQESMKCLKKSLADKYSDRQERPIFSISDLKQKYKNFIDEYPIILSTTFSSVSSLSDDLMYDYVIFDEASQVSVETGILALSCAKNAVIVGDVNQLPNVVDEDTKEKLELIKKKYSIDKNYDTVKNSLLGSICKVLPNVKQTLLREHYRCNPKIIEFCNKKFYDGKLIIMTEDDDNNNPLSLYTTVVGNHSRGHINQREVDVIKKEVLPTLHSKCDDIGVIAPYNDQVDLIRKNIGEEYEVSTVHKFQGREKDTIIMSTVNDVITPFVDNANLLNVAVSRAQKHFCLVTSGNNQAMDRNITELKEYIEYNNGEVNKSELHSIFDYLYNQYNLMKSSFLSNHKKISSYDSENLTYALLEKIIKENSDFSHLRIICHYPLYMLIKDFSLLDNELRRYASNVNTHVDFLIYNSMSMLPVMALETDGYNYHKKGTKQFERDIKKNKIMDLYNLPLLRISTDGSGEKVKIINRLREIMQ